MNRSFLLTGDKKQSDEFYDPIHIYSRSVLSETELPANQIIYRVYRITTKANTETWFGWQWLSQQTYWVDVARCSM